MPSWNWICTSSVSCQSVPPTSAPTIAERQRVRELGITRYTNVKATQSEISGASAMPMSKSVSCSGAPGVAGLANMAWAPVVMPAAPKSRIGVTTTIAR
jgi:hypothetical protein